VPTVSVNGCELYYAEDDFVEPWEPHETVLMSHFVFGNHTEFRRWVPPLAREFRVLRLDRRGNGLSEKPPLGYTYTLDGLLADFVSFLDALGIERVHYAGDSLGGVLGAAFAARHPERVKSLVLCATPCWINPAVQAGFVREGYADPIAAVMGMGSWVYAMTSQGMMAAGQSGDPTRLLRSIYRAEQMALMPAHVIAALMRMVTQRSFDITALLPEIQAPTLLLSPQKSVPTPPEEQAMMRERIPNCEQVVFEGASHGIAFDQPERCAETALTFFRKHRGG
jgi:pimeloyl-ACP methyl ester carboxylesterase